MISLFKDAKEQVGDETALAIVDQIGKHLRVAEIRAGNSQYVGVRSTGSDDGPATKKQLAYLKRLGVKVPAGISKRDASAMLDEALGK